MICSPFPLVESEFLPAHFKTAVGVAPRPPGNNSLKASSQKLLYLLFFIPKVTLMAGWETEIKHLLTNSLLPSLNEKMNHEKT